MDWVNFATRGIAVGSAILFFIAAVLICWRSGTLYPVRARLLRLFISRKEIEDADIRNSLADQDAIVSFRMIYGIDVDTIKGAKELIAFANEKNIPLGLIGRAGNAFDKKTLAIVEKNVPRRAFIMAPAILLLACIWTIGGLSVLATSDSLLASVKSTKTRLWLSADAATTFRFPLSNFEEGSIYRSSCTPDQKNPSIPPGFNKNDKAILCGIWSNPNASTQLSKQVNRQRATSVVAIGILLWFVLAILAWLHTWLAAIQLNSRLSQPATEGARATPPNYT